MSASQKKKLRSEQNTAQMTEKQIAEQKEAKKLRMYTAIFSIAIALMLCVVIVTTVVESGIIQRHTTAATVGEYEISAPEFNHYYVDTVQQFQQSWGQAIALSGLAPNVPLEDQVYDEESGETWADYFLTGATDNMHHTYALYSAAVAEGMTLDEEANAEIDKMIQSVETSVMVNGGFKNLNSYVKTVYGVGCNEDTYRHYVEVQYLASHYAMNHMDTLTYTDEQLREKDAADPIAFNSYSYHEFYLAASNFLEGGTEDENGNKTYSDEEKAAAAAKCEQAAQSLIAENINSVAALDQAIAELNLTTGENNAETPKSTARTDVLSSKLPASSSEWITSSERTEGDLTLIPNESTSTDADGNEVTTINGYYVIYFNGVNDNTFPLSNVRHILVKFEGGMQAEDGTTTYSGDEKAAARAEAEGILAQFQAGETTEEAFAALATEKSDDTGSASNGGLIENILPSSPYVENFLNWSIDRSRQPGDTDIVETEYGYHVMYYVGNSERNYRDTMIQNVLTSDDMNAWEDAQVEAISAEVLNDKYIPSDLMLQAK